MTLALGLALGSPSVGLAQDPAGAATDEPAAWALHLERGRVALETDALPSALQALGEADRLRQGDPLILAPYHRALQATARMSSGSTKIEFYENAAEVARRWVAVEPTCESRLALGESLLGAKADVEASEVLRGALEASVCDPAGALPALYLAGVLTRQGLYSDAEETLVAALGRASEDAVRRIYRSLGFVYAKTKRIDEAVGAYTLAGDEAAASRVVENWKIVATECGNNPPVGPPWLVDRVVGE